MSRVDYSNGADVVTIIEMSDCEYVFDTQDEDGISDFLYGKIGEREHELSGIPVYIEASSWCPLADIGTEYEDEEFTIYIEEVEEEQTNGKFLYRI